MPQFTTILFDMDGTLLDTLEDLADSVNLTMRHFSFPEHNREDYKMMIGAGARDHVRKALPLNKQKDEGLIDRAFTFYKKTYNERWPLHTKLYDGIAELLQELTKRQIKMGIFTNKPHEFTLEMVQHYLASWPFYSVRGALDPYPRKPHPQVVLEMIKDVPHAEKKVLFVGDSDLDILTAKNAGIQSCGVTWGFRPRKELTSAGADFIIDHPQDLLKILL